MDYGRRGLKLIGGILVVYALLVATHKGEFWPFSIYPMFSQAGDPWTRALVRQVDPEHTNWDDLHRVAQLPGQVFPMTRVNINQNDLANFISKTNNWNEKQIKGLKSLFEPVLKDNSLFIYKVTGQLDSQRDTVKVTYRPYIRLSGDEVQFHPSIRQSNTSK